MICSRCQTDKPQDQFYARDLKCKDCRNTLQNAARRERKQKEQAAQFSGFNPLAQRFLSGLRKS